MDTPEEQVPRSRVRSTAPRVQAAAATHPGARAVNADSYLIDEAAGLYAVADGVGDRPRSRPAADTALAAVRAMFGGGWRSHSPAARPVEDARGRLMLGIERAHRQLCAPWPVQEDRMGTTFAGVVVCGGELVIGHLGDSRCYLLRGSKGRMSRQTRDHTVFAEALRARTPYEVAATMPDAHALTRVLGIRCGMGVSPFVRRWEPGDVALLCTDGMSDWLEPEAMTEILLDTQDVGDAARQLVDRAHEAGGYDNATALVVRRAS